MIRNFQIGQVWTATLGLLVALAFLTACGQNELPKDVREVAENFVTVYYQKKDLKVALELCTGAARKKIEAELAELRAADVSNSDKGAPTVDVTYVEFSRVNEGRYTTTWEIKSSAGEKLTANVTLEKVADGWRVSNVSEAES